MDITAHELKVERTARVLVRGDAKAARETWILLHGYAQRADELLEACTPLASSARVLVAPEALSRFYRRGSSGPIGASWMTREAREAEIADYLAYLDRVAAWSAQELAAPRSITVLGYSQGAATAWRWAALGATSIGRLITWGGGLPHDVELGAARAKLAKTRLEIVRGARDLYHSSDVLAQSVQRLASAGLHARVLEFEGAHELAPAVLEQLSRA